MSDADPAAVTRWARRFVAAGAGWLVAWQAAALAFVGSLAWSVRDNLSGRETGTAGPNAYRRRVDRTANAFVLVAFAYLLAGALLGSLVYAYLVVGTFRGRPVR